MMDIKQYLKHDLPDLKALPRLAWFDNSTIESFQDCNREAWYNHMLGFEAKSAPMAAGSVFHAALEEYHGSKNISAANLALAKEYQNLKAVLATGPNRLSFGNLNEAFRLYTLKYANDQVIYHAQEVKFAVWMQGTHVYKCEVGKCVWPPEDPEACFWFVGRFDGVVSFIGKLLLFESKTSGRAGNNESLEMSRQARGYVASINKILKANGYPDTVKGVLFDTTILKSDVEFSRFVSNIHTKQIKEWEDETYDLVAQIRRSWTMQRLPNKNTRSCTRYGLCKFIPVCQSWAGGEKTDPPGVLNSFQKKVWTPF